MAQLKSTVVNGELRASKVIISSITTSADQSLLLADGSTVLISEVKPDVVDNALKLTDINKNPISKGGISKPVYFLNGVPEEIESLDLTGEIKGTKVYGAVWNDLADKIIVPNDTELEFGRCYIFDGENYRLPKKYAEKGYIGIHSDTYGFSMGEVSGKKQLNSAVAGYVLSYVDRIYPTGTPLTYKKNGVLTKANLFIKLFYSERVVGTFWKDEKGDTWNEIQVNGRKWIKIR